MPLSPEVKRLNIVFNEFDGNQARFTKLMGIKPARFSRMLRGMEGYPIPTELIKEISVKLGYSLEWLLEGTGPKKLKRDGPKKVLTDVSDFRGDLAMAVARINKMEKRLEYVINLVEKELVK